VENVVDELLQPNFEKKPSPGEKRSRPERDDAAAIKTYRYLRLGMVLIVLALTASLWREWRTAGCAQGSISAYYYASVGPLFVGGMVAIGVSLIVIKGATIVEDILLNVAGMLAPIVAFVPTTPEAACVPGQRPRRAPTALTADVLARVHNNVWALLVAGTAALLIGIVLYFKEQDEEKVAPPRQARLLALGFHAAVVAVGWSLYASGTIVRLHGKAAIAMFVALGLAAVASGRSLQRIKEADDKPPHWMLYKNVYYAIGASMAVFGVAVGLWPGDWDHRTLVQELGEITLFVAMWLVQSFERWGRVISATD
jgi:hypothetical protein